MTVTWPRRVEALLQQQADSSVVGEERRRVLMQGPSNENAESVLVDLNWPNERISLLSQERRSIDVYKGCSGDDEMLESQRNTERRLPLFRAEGASESVGNGARQGPLRLGTVAEYSLVISNSHSYASSGTSRITTASIGSP